MLRDTLAGALLVNTIPHAVMGLAGRRFPTPFGGRESTPAANTAWAAVNLAGASGLLASAGWRSIGRAEAAKRLASVQVGVFAMATFATAYELRAGRRRGTGHGAGDGTLPSGMRRPASSGT